MSQATMSVSTSAAHTSWMLGRYDEVLAAVDPSVARGFFCYPWYTRDAWLDPIRNDPRVIDTMRQAEKRWREAEMAFHQHPGSRVLTVGT